MTSAALETRREPPWDELDPGIRGVVRALWEMGFDTTDSGDGRFKATLGLEPGDFWDTPHVHLRTEDIHRDGVRLFEWVEAQGWDGSDVQVQADLFRDPHSTPPGQIAWLLTVHGEPLYDWRAP